MFTQAYAITYIAVCLMCAIVTGSLGAKMNRDIGVFREVMFFRGFAVGSIAVMLAEAVWRLGLLIDGGLSLPLVWAVNMIDLVASTFTVYFCFLFVAEHITEIDPARPRGWTSRLMVIPLLVSLFLHLSSPWLHLSFYINDAGAYVRGPLYIVHFCVCMLYLFMPIGHMLSMGRHASLNRQHEYVRLTTFLTIPIVGAFLQVLVGEAPFTSMAITLATLFFFVMLQESRVTTDALTKLTNRTRMNDVLTAKIRRADTTPFTLFIADVNRFKQINDAHGHVAGDRALVCVADAFRALGERHPSLFICRYGGDEFLFTLDDSADTTPDQLMAQLHDALEAVTAEKNLPFRLELGIGHRQVSDPREDLEHAIASADRLLYERKRTK